MLSLNASDFPVKRVGQNAINEKFRKQYGCNINNIERCKSQTYYKNDRDNRNGQLISIPDRTYSAI